VKDDRNDTLKHKVLLVELSAKLAAAYVRRSSIPWTELPKVITEIHAALDKVALENAPLPVAQKAAPAVNPNKSILADYIEYGLTPEAYREKWSLDSSYPMVAPNYSTRRSALAKENGLGRKRMGL
jgi:predicted transcriptional regulator